MIEDLSRNKTIFVFFVIIGSFALLWPQILYPIITNMGNHNIQPNQFDKGCCEIIFENDLNAPNVLREICGEIVKNSSKINEKTVQKLCQQEIYDKCSINLTMIFFQKNFREKSSIKLLKQSLQAIRSMNLTLCLQNVFEISRTKFLDFLSDRVTYMNSKLSDFERVHHNLRNSNLRADKSHPAFQERGKIASNLIVPPRKSHGASKRPPGPGTKKYLKQNEQNSMGLLSFLMPIYTFALVVFSIYAGIKTFFRNQNSTYPTSTPDADFHREIFLQSGEQSRRQSDDENNSIIDSKRIGWKEVETITNAITALVAQVDRDIEERIQLKNRCVRFDNDDSSVKVVGLQSSVNKTNQEPFNSDEDSKSDLFPDPFKKYPDKSDNQIDLNTPKILLDDMPIGNVQVLVTDTITNNDSDGNNNTMVLSSKMTLSVISNSDEENDDDDDDDEDQELSKYSTSSLHTAIDYLNVNEDTDDEVEEVSDEE